MTLHRLSRRAGVVLLTVLLVLGAGAGVAVEFTRGEQWRSSTDALVRTWSVDSLLLSGATTDVGTSDQADAAVVAVSQEVLGRAAADLDDGRAGQAQSEDVTATPVASSHIVTITATGRTAAEAETTSEAVAEAFAGYVRTTLTDAAAGLLATEAGQNTPEIQVRAQLLSSTLQPVEVFRTAQPTQTSPSVQTPIALGVVGLALGALVLLGLSMLRPAVTSARDAQRQVGLPAAAFDGERGPDTARLIARLRETRPEGKLLFAPISAEAEKTGVELVEWIRSRSGDEAASRIELAPEPTGAVLADRPAAGEVAALILVVPAGTPRSDLTDGVALLAPWRAPDAVVVVG